MKIPFQKYQGTGNDFIMIDNRQLVFPKNNARLISAMCDRKFGIGADGLILLENHSNCDFRMVYFNSDGNESTMCGNGGRAICRFAADLGFVDDTIVFEAIDGLHHAFLLPQSQVRIQMKEVTHLISSHEGLFLDTGSPHHVQRVDELESLNVKKLGAELRYGQYGPEGANINFVNTSSQDYFEVRTYERGVEDETLSCGTGVTAVALAMHYWGIVTDHWVKIKTLGGILEVEFQPTETGYRDIWLIGPVAHVFEGVWMAD